MSFSSFTRRLRFNKQEYQEVLLRMSAGAPSAAAEDRRNERHDYHVPDIPLAIDHPEGGTSRFLVFGRNISRNGLSVLHGGYVHPGSECHVMLAQVDGDKLAVTGVVRHCRLVAGSCHEIGVQFHQEVDPALLLGSENAASDKPTEVGDNGFQPIAGAILIADDFPPDRLLLQHQLEIFGLDIMSAATPGATLDAIKRTNYDLVIFGLNLASQHAVKTIGEIRANGYNAPVLVLTPETDAQLLNAAREAGATDVIAKPYYLDLLVAQLQAHLSSPQRQAPVYSTAAGQSGMPTLISKFVEVARRVADQIERTFAENEAAELREYCCQIKGAGCGYGFQNITVAAISVLGSLDRREPREQLEPRVEALVACCRALEAPVVAESDDEAEAA
ncbi:MAG: response regulator [Phycisphaerales bacterium]|nr:response regulator [Phycisphaerae bacterium]NNF43839.1 response regulator [Phycisphaerales bacterium]NNM27364.1 response regulator [Phycisphaerales bacterium]